MTLSKYFYVCCWSHFGSTEEFRQTRNSFMKILLWANSIVMLLIVIIVDVRMPAEHIVIDFHQWKCFSERARGGKLKKILLASLLSRSLTVWCCALQQAMPLFRNPIQSGILLMWGKTDNRVLSCSIEALLVTSSCGSANSVSFIFYPHSTACVKSMDFSAVDKLLILKKDENSFASSSICGLYAFICTMKDIYTMRSGI